MSDRLKQLVNSWLKENEFGFRIDKRHGNFMLRLVGESGLYLIQHKERNWYFNLHDPQSLDRLYSILSFEEERIKGRENRKSWRTKWRNRRMVSKGY